MIVIQIKNSNDSLHSSLPRKPLGTFSLPLFLMEHILKNDTYRYFFKIYVCKVCNISMKSATAKSLKDYALGGEEECMTTDSIWPD